MQQKYQKLFKQCFLNCFFPLTKLQIQRVLIQFLIIAVLWVASGGSPTAGASGSPSYRSGSPALAYFSLL